MRAKQSASQWFRTGARQITALLACVALVAVGCSSSSHSATSPSTSSSTPGSTPPGSSTSAPVQGSTVGVTPTTITIEVSGPFSGVYGPLFNAIYSNGAALWQKQVNAAGGINGR